MRWQASYPLMPGSRMSRRTRSKPSRPRRSRPCSPDSAEAATYPWRFSRSTRVFPTRASSSMTRISAMAGIRPGSGLSAHRCLRDRIRRHVPLVQDHLAVPAVERQGPAVADSLLEIEGHARLDGPAVDVQGDHLLLPLHDHLVDGLDLVHGVDRPVRVALLDLAPAQGQLGGPRDALEPHTALDVGGVA